MSMRESSLNSKARKQDYINVTQSVLKLLRIVKDNSPKRLSENRQRAGHETLDLRDLQVNISDTIGMRRKERKKNSLKFHDIDSKRLLPPRPKRHCLDLSEAESTELMFPVIESRRLQRSITQPPANEAPICSTMALAKKDEVDIKLETLRSKQNLHSLFEFEESLSRPLPAIAYSCKRRIRTDFSNRNLQPINRDQIAKLEKVLVESTEMTESSKSVQKQQKKSKGVEYGGWEFEKTNNEWEFTIMEAIKHKR